MLVQAGDTVTVTGNSSFCSTYTTKVEELLTRYDKITGKPYQVIVTKEQKFDSRTGYAIDNLHYYLANW